MKLVKDMDYHDTSEQLTQILCSKTQNTSPEFFRVVIASYFSIVASMMRTSIVTLDRGEVPVNMYAVALATSGFGKGRTINLLEDQVINHFQERFTEEVFPSMAEKHLIKLAHKKSIRNSTDPEEELEALKKEFVLAGPFVFTFDSGTSPALKQARHKLLMANTGALALVIDEIGSNLLGNTEVLNTYLELFDMGKIKQKLIKNTKENLRVEEIKGKTPTNLLMMGTPDALLNGGKEEAAFDAFLETGYARRPLFTYIKHHTQVSTLSPKDILKQRLDKTTAGFISDLSIKLGALANIDNTNKKLPISEENTLLLIEYEQSCVTRAEALPEHAQLKKAELAHRHWKTLKLAGAYAFIDNTPEILERHIYNAIKLVEESGDAFTELLKRERPYVKLARYIAQIGRPVTQADLVTELPYYKGTTAQKADLLHLAVSYGYQNNILIQSSFQGHIEFLTGETIEEVDLDNITISYSRHLTEGYIAEQIPFNQLHILTQAPGVHWCAHHFNEGYRKDDNVIEGFNLVVLDVDHGVKLSTAKLLLKDYKAHFYTTKRHTEEENRFRIILPMNYNLKLSTEDYKEFFNNLVGWLPFEVDTQTFQRSRKWLSCVGHHEYQEGELLDVLPFIPRTSKNTDFKSQLLTATNLNALERWVITNVDKEGRNNVLLRYSLVLKDAGFVINDIQKRVLELNAKLANPLEETEIMTTIMTTINKVTPEE